MKLTDLDVQTLGIHEIASLSEWNRVVEESPNGLLFHLNEWLEVLADTQRLSLRRFGLYAGADKQLVGVLPIFFGRLGPIRVAGSPFIVEDTPYMGPVVAEHLVSDALKAAQRVVAREKARFLRILLPYMPSSEVRRELTDNGFVCTVKHTHVLNLAEGKKKLWDRMEGRCRTAVRRAENSGVEVVRINAGPEARVAMEAYYSLVEGVYRRQGRKPPNPPGLYHLLWQKFHEKGMLSLLMARAGENNIAGVLLAHYKNRVYYLDGAYDRSYSKLCATNLLLWRAIEWAAAQGYREFDFVGSDIPRLADFKASFGGELVQRACIEWASSKAVSFLRNWYGKHGKQLLEKFAIILGRHKRCV